jgi:hypothetical protein
MNFAKKVLDDAYPTCVLPESASQTFGLSLGTSGFTNPDGKDQWRSKATFFGLPGVGTLGGRYLGRHRG